ncbi:complex I subunit 5 family protein [Candidatus Bipolaricaulota bacterium]
MPLILLPLLRFAFAVLTITFARARKLLTIVSHLIDAVLLSQLVLSLVRGVPELITVGGAPAGIGISLIGDQIGLTFAVLAWILSIAVSAYTWKDQLRPYFFLLLNLLIGSCYALSFTMDLFNAYLLFELSTLASFLLVGYQRRPRQIWASLHYLALSSLGMSMFLLGIGVVYAHCGSLDLAELKTLISASAGEPWVLLAGSLLVAGIAVKAGVFIFSLWLPSAHARAMPAVSALLSGLVIKMGVVGLFRLAAVFPIDLPLIVLGAITGILGIIYALNSYDIKRLLAFHTLSQIGYILIGFGAHTDVARLGALSYEVAHGLFKALLFLTIGEAAARAGGSDLKTLIENKRDIPRGTRIALIIAVLGIIGLPPLAGFDAKAILEDGLPTTALRLIMLLISIGTVMSFAKLTPVLFSRSTCRANRSRILSYAWLGAGIILFWPLSLLLVSPAINLHALSVPHIVEALVVIAVGGALYLLIRKKSFRLPEGIFRLETSPLVILVGFFLVYALIVLGQ